LKKHRPQLQTILAHSNSFHCDSILKNNDKVNKISNSNSFNEAVIVDYDSQKNIIQNDSESDDPDALHAKANEK
jgi:hypothetical protein